GTATAFSLRLRLHYKAARAGGVMRKEAAMSIERSIELMKKHPVIMLLSLFIVVVSSMLTLIEDGSQVYGMYKSTLGYNAELDKKLNSLNVEVDIGYFDSLLGAPAIKNRRTLTH